MKQRHWIYAAITIGFVVGQVANRQQDNVSSLLSKPAKAAQAGEKLYFAKDDGSGSGGSGSGSGGGKRDGGGGKKGG